jgi:hypothetical protein
MDFLGSAGFAVVAVVCVVASVVVPLVACVVFAAVVVVTSPFPPQAVTSMITARIRAISESDLFIIMFLLETKIIFLPKNARYGRFSV